MTSNRNKYVIIKTDIDKILSVILQVGIILSLFFGVSGFFPAYAQDGEKFNPEDNILLGNNADSSMQQTDQVIIKYKDTLAGKSQFDPASANQMQRISNAAGVSLIHSHVMSGEAHVIRLPARMSLPAVQVIIERLLKLPEVEFAEPDTILQHTLIPNDVHYSTQWHYWAPTAGNFGINAPAAWDLTTGSSSINIAVVDTGITNHTEFVGRTVPGYDFISDIQTANDGNGRDSDPSDPGDWVARNECSPGSVPSDSSWHGTHTAGTIGATSNNGIGVAGIDWNAKILPVRVLGKCGGYTSDIIDGMLWAAGLTVTGAPTNANPAKVINVSLGGTGSCGTTFQNAINSITTAGATVVAAAGNGNVDASNFFPANCNGVITVAATNRNGSKASYSNYGSTVEISAPGGDGSYTDWVVSTYNTGTQGPADDTYAYMSGTSMAAPHVSGVVSLLYSIIPSLTPAQVLQVLQNSVTNFPLGSSCTTSICGSGIVNAGAAMTTRPTDVTLANFTAKVLGLSVQIDFRTVSEIDLIGFNLYRAETIDGSRIHLNSTLIPAKTPGQIFGNDYQYLDVTVAPGIGYYYWIELVFRNMTQDIGPVPAEILFENKIWLPYILR